MKGISFSNIQVSNVSVPINIDQYYCDKGKCSNQTSAVAISDVTFKKIRGTYIDKALYLACSDNMPCTGLNLVDIELRPVKAEISHNSFYWSSYGQSEHNNLYLRKRFSARTAPALGDYHTKFLNIHELQNPTKIMAHQAQAHTTIALFSTHTQRKICRISTEPPCTKLG